MDEKRGLYEAQNRPKTAPASRKPERVRWADEQRLYAPWHLAVITFNGLLLALGVLGLRCLSTRADTRGPEPPRLEHEVLDVVAFPPHPPADARAALTWTERTRRQAAPRAAAANNTPIQTFQVDVPLLGQGGAVVGAGTPDGFAGVQATASSNATASCQVTLGVNVFSDSFGSPLVADYTPPSCVGDSNTAVMNLTVTSQGTQFDRLAILYLSDTEIFRTSTEEPRLQGVSWTYTKDMSQYMPLWRQPQRLIFDLPNTVDANATPNPLTGTYNTTLTATFFSAVQSVNTADMIIPISARLSNQSQPSVFTIPTQDASASNVIDDFPRNAARAIFSVSATGQADEEFWWSNVLQSDTQTYDASNTTIPGYSPFREVQVLIDGQLAGVQWPYPVIFTGGVSPTLWTPMVGIDAFDLKEGEIDISPWLGVLCNGQPHNFSINVVGLDDDGGANATLSPGVGGDWKVTGKIFIWLDANNNSVTSGAAPTITGTAPTIGVSQTLSKNATGFNDTLRYTTSVSRQFSVSGSITTSSGTQAVTWTQALSHTDDGTLSNTGGSQITVSTTQGTDTSTFPGHGFTSAYSYPLNSQVTSETLANGTTRFSALLSRTKTVRRSVGGGGGGSVFPSGLQLFAALPATADLVGRMTETSFTTTQNGSAVLLSAAGGGGATGYGSQSQSMRFGGGTAAGVLGDEPDSELYFRNVSVSSTGAVASDVERLAGENVMGARPPATGVGAPQSVVDTGLSDTVLDRMGLRAAGARSGSGAH